LILIGYPARVHNVRQRYGRAQPGDQDRNQ